MRRIVVLALAFLVIAGCGSDDSISCDYCGADANCRETCQNGQIPPA